MAPFDRSHTSSYLPSVVTMAISRIVCEIWRLIGKKSRHFYTPPVFVASAAADPVRVLWKWLMMVKLEWLGYRMVKELWRYVKPFSSDTGTSRTDRQTDRWTELLYQYRASICWRAIKTEWCGYPLVKKVCRYVELFCQNTGMWQTNRRTDRQTSCDGIVCAICMVKHGKIVQFVRHSLYLYATHIFAGIYAVTT